MSLSFSLKPRPADVRDPVRRRILITGAAGRIGSCLAENIHTNHDLRLLVHDPGEADALQGWGETMTADLTSLEQMKSACEGIDTVVHLAGDPSPNAVWEDLLQTNIVGTYNVMVAARAAGCRRVIYASSIHAVGGYPASVQVKSSDPVNPGDLYGVSKCFGEALGRYMATQEGLEVIVLRIGAFTDEEKAVSDCGLPVLDSYVSQRDLISLIGCCVGDESLHFAIFNGVSDNAFQRLDISDARELVGYAQEDDFFQVNPTLAPLAVTENRLVHNLQDPWQESGLREELGEETPASP